MLLAVYSLLQHATDKFNSRLYQMIPVWQVNCLNERSGTCLMYIDIFHWDSTSGPHDGLNLYFDHVLLPCIATMYRYHVLLPHVVTIWGDNLKLQPCKFYNVATQLVVPSDATIYSSSNAFMGDPFPSKCPICIKMCSTIHCCSFDLTDIYIHAFSSDLLDNGT